jgi:hypothetical protein
MDEWNNHEKNWRKLAKDRSRTVEFPYWGAHEIWGRLSKDSHRGRYLFWFNKELFSSEWFSKRIDEAVANVGPRYTPDLNVELPIAKVLDGAGTTAESIRRLQSILVEVHKSYKRCRTPKSHDFAKGLSDSVDESIISLLKFASDTNIEGWGTVDWERLMELASIGRQSTNLLIDELEKDAEDAKAILNAERKISEPPRENHSYEISTLRRLLRDLYEVGKFAESLEAQLWNNPFLLIVGGAGSGKTHLLCDVAKRRIAAKRPTILLLGQHFKDEEPWTQIARHLDFSGTRDELLGALEAAAGSVKSRALIFIDALNEGEGKLLWVKYLAGILTVLGRYPGIGLVVSVRQSYETLVIPPGLTGSRLLRVVHEGFADTYHEAAQAFFKYYGIMQSSVPILDPEFNNPLFLKTFCLALKNKGLHSIPAGLQGIRSILLFFIESVQDKLSKPSCLNFDPGSPLVHSALERLSNAMAESGRTWVPKEHAKKIIDSLLPGREYDRTLFKHLIEEHLISEDRYWDEVGEWDIGIRFTYERFADHLVIESLIRQFVDRDNPSKSFSSDSPLGRLVKDERECYLNQGLVDALAIQLPEVLGVELPDMAPHVAAHSPVAQAFLQSLIWRKPDAVTDRTTAYINEHLLPSQRRAYDFFDTILTVSSNPTHLYNADFIHKNLIAMSMPGRDALWSVYLHRRYFEHSSLSRIVEWAWNSDDKTHISDDAIRLAGIALTWCLTSSNRFLRDRATKALVSLLESRMGTLRIILKTFQSVNDLHVAERLFAVAYGCAMRCSNLSEVTLLATETYDLVFRAGRPPAHVLLRDYARGVIEVALRRGAKLTIDVSKVRPPYRSPWPKSVPSEKALEMHGQWTDKMKDEEWARVHLYSSIMREGDFARYVIDPNIGKFTSQRLTDPEIIHPRKREEVFERSLSGPQKKAYAIYKKLVEHRGLKIIISKIGDDLKDETGLTSKEAPGEKNAALQAKIGKAKGVVRKLLARGIRDEFDRFIVPYLLRGQFDLKPDTFDLKLAKRFILDRVLKMGWTVERFGEFDRNVDQYRGGGREAKKAERIGKKYQWIALYELLARVTDNYRMKSERWSNELEPYQGSWQLYGRDIDPSCVLKATGTERWWSSGLAWWMPQPYEKWETPKEAGKWLSRTKDLPSIKSLLQVMSPADKSNWLVLNSYCSWEQPRPAEEERYEMPTRRIWFKFRAFLVKKADRKSVMDWGKQHDFRGERFVDVNGLTSVFLGELFDSPAFDFHNNSYYDREGWTRGFRSGLPTTILGLSDHYLWEISDHGYDCSLDDSISINLPCKWLVDALKLEPWGGEGVYRDKTGRTIAYDPSVKSPGRGSLLFRADAAFELLDSRGYSIIWLVIGEKDIIGGKRDEKEWKGRLEMLGIYALNEKSITGQMRAELHTRDGRKHGGYVS